MYKKTIAIDFIAALIFLVNSVIWSMDGSRIIGMILGAAALFFIVLGVVQIRELKKINKGK